MLRILSLLFCLCLGASNARAQVPYQPPLVTGQTAIPTGGCYPGSPLPGDIAGVTFKALFSVCAVTNKWLNNNLFDVTAQSSTVTIKAVNGYPDVRKLATLMGISPSIGIGGLPVSQIYDQSGNGNNCTQASATHQFAVWLINGKVFFAGDGMLVDYINSFSTPANVDKFCTIGSGLSVNNQAASIYAVTQLNIMGNEAGFDGSYYSSLFTSGTTTGSAGTSGFTVGPNYNGWGNNDWQTFGGATTSPELVPETQPAVIGIIAGSSNMTFTQNEESSTTAAITAGTATGGTLGYLPFFSQNSGYYGRWQFFGIGNSAFTTPQQVAERNANYWRFNVASTQKYAIFVDGPSIDDGTGSLIGGVNGYGWAEQLRDLIPYPTRWGNSAVYGATIEQLTTNFSTVQCKFYNAAYAKNLLIAPGAAAQNSINGGDTGAQAYTALTAYISAATTCGWSAANIFVYTLFGATGQAATYNTALIAGAPGLGINVIGPSVTGVSPGCPVNSVVANYQSTNAQYFNQSTLYTLHPTITGYNSYAKCLWPQAIQKAIGP